MHLFVIFSNLRIHKVINCSIVKVRNDMMEHFTSRVLNLCNFLTKFSGVTFSNTAFHVLPNFSKPKNLCKVLLCKDCYYRNKISEAHASLTVVLFKVQGLRRNFEIGGRGGGTISDSILGGGHKTLFLTDSL